MATKEELIPGVTPEDLEPEPTAPQPDLEPERQPTIEAPPAAKEPDVLVFTPREALADRLVAIEAAIGKRIGTPLFAEMVAGGIGDMILERGLSALEAEFERTHGVKP